MAMFNFSVTGHAVGLESSSRYIRGANLVLSRGKPTVEKVFEAPIVEGEDLTQLLAPYLPGDRYLVTTGMKGSEVLIRSLHLPLTKDSDIDTAVVFQAEPLLPYPIENALLASIRVAQQGQGTDLTVLSIRKDHLQRHLEAYQVFGIEPEFVSCFPAALVCFSTLFELPKGPYIVVNLNETSLTCVLAKEGKLIASHTINQGTQTLLEAYRKDLGAEADAQFSSLDFAALDLDKAPQLAQAVEALRLSGAKTVYAIAKELKEEAPEMILLAGEGFLLHHLADSLLSGLNMPLTIPKGTPEVKLTAEELLKFSVAIGLGINALRPMRDAVNFRKQELAYPDPWKRTKKPMAAYMMVSLLVAACFYLFGKAYLGYQEDNAKKAYLELLRDTHKTYNAFEAEYLAKFPQTDENGDTVILPIASMKISDLENRLRYMEKDLKPPVDTFPFYPNVPRVSDLLAWLSVHPKVIGDSKDESMGSPLIQIENLTYTLVKRPDQKQRQEKYQVKVEIDFTSPAPKWAREFHDALIAPNQIVDPKGEVKWSANKGKYRTSFYLKDKTSYPTS